MNGYEVLNYDCLLNVFSFLSIKDFCQLSSINQDYSRNNDFWKKTCPYLIHSQSKIDFKTEGKVRQFFFQSQFNVEIIKILRCFLERVLSGGNVGSIELTARDTPFLVFKINNPSKINPGITEKIAFKKDYVTGLDFTPVKKEYEYPTGTSVPFFVMTKAEFSEVNKLSAPFKTFLKEEHKKVGCGCKVNENCDPFIQLAKTEMVNYLKDKVSKENYSTMIKKIENVCVNKFTSEEQISIVAESFPADLKRAAENFVVFNRQVKQGNKFHLTTTPPNKFLVLSSQSSPGKTLKFPPKMIKNNEIKRSKALNLTITSAK